MSRRFLSITAFVVAVLLLPKGDVDACGPDWEPEVFVSASSPDNYAAFADGQLGILQSGFDSNDYAVAYRYLNGGRLSVEEQHAYAPPAVQLDRDEAWWRAKRAAEPRNRWIAERAKYAPPNEPAAQAPSLETDWQGSDIIGEYYVNCPDPAFENAMATLDSRAKTWSRDSKWLADWIQGQDAVFTNCAGKTAAMPAPAPADAPTLLKQDRAYQTASATFYARQFDQAAQQFAAIDADHDSPWSKWGAYLEARSVVRKAFAMGKQTDPWSGDRASYDEATMRRAQQMLETLLAQPNPRPSRAVIQNELNFIRIRTEPGKRAAEIATALAGPAPDPDFDQDLKDLSFLLAKNVDVKGAAPLLDWIAAWRGGGTAATVYAKWQQTHELPWLAVALARTAPSDRFASPLVADAAQIAPRSPAYDTVFYHRVRLLIGLNHVAETRSLLDAALPALRKQKPSSNLNALLGERMTVARNFSEFLEFAPRPTLSTGSQGANDLQGQCNERAHAVNEAAPCPEAQHPVEFDADAVRIINQKIPLPLLIEAAKSTALPQNLREAITIVAWTRSVLLKDAQSAAALAPRLPKPIRDAAGTSVGFAADFTILHNPGIRPYLESGIPRVASYSYFDAFRNNWWCKPWNEQEGYGEHTAPAIPPPAFLPASQSSLADSEYEQLQKLPDSAAVIGQRVIDYAKAHPDDPRVPEALALTVRATHYACQSYSFSPNGDTKSPYTPTSKAAFELLHRQYPKSPWTAKTRYYY
jgi:hypothetical protein